MRFAGKPLSDRMRLTCDAVALVRDELPFHLTVPGLRQTCSSAYRTEDLERGNATFLCFASARSRVRNLAFDKCRPTQVVLP